MPADPRERLVIVPLANSIRVDVIAALPGLPEHRLPPEHFDTLEKAERFAVEMARITGARIIRPGEPDQ